MASLAIWQVLLDILHHTSGKLAGAFRHFTWSVLRFGRRISTFYTLHLDILHYISGILVDAF